MMRVAIPLVVSYLLGSIPFGFLVAKAKRIDLRQVGSGNIGSTNIYRALGLRAAILVFALDAGKGFVGTRLVPALGPAGLDVSHLRFICALAVVLGSVASIFMRFKGGKGVATGAGVFLGLAPLAAAISIAIWAGLVAIFRYVSLGSLAAACALPILVACFGSQTYAHDPVFYLAVAVAAIVFLSHRSNIRRLLSGREQRVRRVRPEGAASTARPAGKEGR
jgi:glycerol-3-phosphate acyltransferase PlsY